MSEKETREEIKIRTREATRAFKEELEQKREELKKMGKLVPGPKFRRR